MYNCIYVPVYTIYGIPNIVGVSRVRGGAFKFIVDTVVAINLIGKRQDSHEEEQIQLH